MPLRGPMPMPTAPSLDLAGSEPLFGGDAKGGGDAALGGLPPAQLAGPLRAAYQLSAAPQPMLLPQQALFGNMAPAAAGGGLGLGDGGNGGLGVPPLPPGYQRRREGELGLGFGDPLAEPLHPPLHSACTQQLVATGDAYRVGAPLPPCRSQRCPHASPAACSALPQQRLLLAWGEGAQPLRLCLPPSTVHA